MSNLQGNTVFGCCGLEDVYTKNYTYTNGLQTQETDTDGRKTVYTYDGENNIASTVQTVNSSDLQTSIYTYNYLKKPISVTKKVRKGDIFGNAYTDNVTIDVVDTYSYDLNSNLINQKDASGTVTSYSYDKINRNLTASKQLKNASGTLISNVATSKTYTWDGQTATETDANGKVTTYDYDKQGNQVKKQTPSEI